MKRFTKWAMLATVALVLVVLTAGCTSNVVNNASPSPSASPQPTRDPNFVPKNTSGYLPYSNRSAGFTIQYPPSWQLVDSGSMVRFRVLGQAGQPEASQEMGHVAMVKPSNLASGYTLNDYAKMGVDSFSSLPDFKSLGCSNSTLSGYPSQKCSFTFTTVSGYPAQGFFEVTIANDMVYIIDYGAVHYQNYYSVNLETAQNMIQSFNIVS